MQQFGVLPPLAEWATTRRLLVERGLRCQAAECGQPHKPTYTGFDVVVNGPAAVPEGYHKLGMDGWRLFLWVLPKPVDPDEHIFDHMFDGDHRLHRMDVMVPQADNVRQHVLMTVVRVGKVMTQTNMQLLQPFAKEWVRDYPMDVCGMDPVMIVAAHHKIAVTIAVTGHDSVFGHFRTGTGHSPMPTVVLDPLIPRDNFFDDADCFDGIPDDHTMIPEEVAASWALPRDIPVLESMVVGGAQGFVVPFEMKDTLIQALRQFDPEASIAMQETRLTPEQESAMRALRQRASGGKGPGLGATTGQGEPPGPFTGHVAAQPALEEFMLSAAAQPYMGRQTLNPAAAETPSSGTPGVASTSTIPPPQRSPTDGGRGSPGIDPWGLLAAADRLIEGMNTGHVSTRAQHNQYVVQASTNPQAQQAKGDRGAANEADRNPPKGAKNSSGKAAGKGPKGPRVPVAGDKGSTALTNFS